jgi:hypothetical protein
MASSSRRTSLVTVVNIKLALLRALIVVGSILNNSNRHNSSGASNVFLQQQQQLLVTKQHHDTINTDDDETLVVDAIFHNDEDPLYSTKRRRISTTISSNNNNNINNNNNNYKGGKMRYFETTTEGGNSFYGIMFDIKAKNDIIVETMDVLLLAEQTITNSIINNKNNIVGTTALRIYTKGGSYWNLETNTFYPPSYWTMVSTTESLAYFPIVKSVSYSNTTTNTTTASIPYGIFNSIPISAGSIQAFYISLNTSSLLYSTNSATSSNHSTNNSNMSFIDTTTTTTIMNNNNFNNNNSSSSSSSSAILKENEDLYVYVGAGVGPIDLFHQGFVTQHTNRTTMFFGRVFNGMFYYTRPFYSTPPSTASGVAGKELSTTYVGGNGGYGIMFDIAALQPITIQTLAIHARSTNSGTNINNNKEMEVSVWTLTSGEGSYVGHEYNLTTDWKCIVTCSVVGAGIGNPTIIPEELFPDIYTAAGHVRAFYISLPTPDLLYTTTSNDTYFIALNDDLQIINGVGVSSNHSTITGSFGSSSHLSSSSQQPTYYHPNRAFNGAIKYILQGTTESKSTSISTTIGGANSALGNMFDIEALKDITVKRLDIVISTTKQVHVAIYTKIGSYRGYGEAMTAVSHFKTKKQEIVLFL